MKGKKVRQNIALSKTDVDIHGACFNICLEMIVWQLQFGTEKGKTLKKTGKLQDHWYCVRAAGHL